MYENGCRSSIGNFSDSMLLAAHQSAESISHEVYASEEVVTVVGNVWGDSRMLFIKYLLELEKLLMGCTSVWCACEGSWFGR